MTPPEAVNWEQIENESISVTVAVDGIIRIEGEEVPNDQLETWISGVMEDRESDLVRLKIDKNLTKKTYGDVFAQLSGAGARIAVLGENEE